MPRARPSAGILSQCVLLSSNIIESFWIPEISRRQLVSINSSQYRLSIQGQRRQKTTEDEEEFAAWKGGPPRAPPAREAAVAPTAGGCRPPNPPLRKIFLIFGIFLGGARTCFGAHFGSIWAHLGSIWARKSYLLDTTVVCSLIYWTRPYNGDWCSRSGL